jgi:subtilisin family serine protease
VRPIRVLLVLLGLLLASGLSGWMLRPASVTPAPGSAPPSPPAIVPDQLLIGFRPETDDAARAAIVARHGGRVTGWLADLRVAVVALPAGRPLGVVAGEYAAEAAVRYAEPNYLYHASGTPNDPRYGDDGLWGLGAIDAPTAWATTTGSDNVVVGVVDTGIDYTHPDLAANIWTAPAGWSVMGCGPGSHGYRAINDAASCDPQDDQGHGTHVAGTIGAVGDNGIGVVGVNWHVRLMALKCLDAQGMTRSSDAVQVIAYAIAAKQAGVNLRVLNLSWTDPSPSQTLLAAIEQADAAGILIVAAAGDTAL